MSTFLLVEIEPLTMSGLSLEETLLLNSVSDGVTVNSQNVFLYVNTAFAEMVGYNVSELIGMNVLKVTAPEYIELINERSSKRQQGLEVVSIYELELIRIDGTRFPVEFNASRIDFDEKSSSLTIVRDISERKKAAKVLVESEERYRGLFDGMIDGFAYHQVVYDDNGEPVDYTYVEINERFTELVGLGREIIGKNVTEVLPGIEDDPADWIRVYGELAKNGGELRFEQYAEPLSKWYSVSAYSPKPGYFATIFQDITERRQVEEALRESEALLRRFLESATDGFVMFDESMRFITANDNWLHRSGLKREDAVGKKMLEIFPVLKETEQYAAFLKVLEKGESVEYHAIGAVSGRGGVFDVSAFKVGKVLGIVSRDVSDSVRYQGRLEALHSHAAQLASLDSREEVAHSTMEIIRDLLGFKIGSFGFVEDGKIVFTEFREESSILELDLDGQGITVRAVKSGETQLVMDTQQESDYIAGRADGETLSELDVPIKVRGSVVALINLESNQVGGFQEEDQVLVEILGLHVGSALDRLNREKVVKNALEALGASEGLLRRSQEIAHIGSWSLDLETNKLTWSDEVNRIFGYAPQEFEGTYEAFLDAVHPLDRELVHQAFTSAVEDGQSYEVVHRVLRSDGSVRWVRERSMEVLGEGGVPVQSVGMVHDITDQVLAEVELKNSESLFRGFMQSATEGFLMYDENLCFVEVNDSWLHQAGLEREDVIGKHILDVFPSLKELGRYDDYLKVLETGEPVEYHAVAAASGRDLIIDLSVFKMGDVIGIVSKDVSEQDKHQRRLVLLHGHAAAMSQAESIIAISEITRESLITVLGFNRGSLGLVEGSVLNHKYRWGIDSGEEFKMPLDGPGLTVKVVNTGESIRIGNVSEAGLYVDGIGDPVTFSELVVPVIVSDRVVGVINIESEVLDAFSEEDQVLVETLASHVASAFSKIRYSERLSALHSFALELDLAESVEDVVETSFRIMRDGLGLQYASFQLLRDEGLVTVGIDDMTFLDLVLPLSGKGITVRVAREARTVLLGDVRGDPDFVQGPSDSLSELAVPIMVEDGVLGVLNVESTQLDAFSIDDARLMEVLAQNVGSALFRLRAAEDSLKFERQLLVQKLEVEQEQELSRLKTRFMSTATHEIRTPLSSILGYTELIQMDEENLSEAQRRYFDVIQRNVHRLTVLTDDLLDQQRLEEGKMGVSIEPVNIRELVEGVESEFVPILAGKGQVMGVSCVDVVVKMDRLRVMQVLVNLLSNASKFSPEDGVIRVDVVETGDGVRFSVVDQGVGIGEEDLGKLFNPFPGVLVDGNVSGTGLGLSICKGIVELHGGKIWAESEGAGQGSTFIFTIPIK